MRPEPKKIIPLLRLDIGVGHRNPDGQEIQGPHLHIYREGYDAKWAYPLPIDKFKNIKDIRATLNDFMKFCNIVDPPNINLGLFK